MTPRFYGSPDARILDGWDVLDDRLLFDVPLSPFPQTPPAPTMPNVPAFIIAASREGA